MSTNLLLVRDLPEEEMVEKAVSMGVCQVNYAMIQSIICTTSDPGTAAKSHNLGPPAIQQDAEMSDTEEAASGKIN